MKTPVKVVIRFLLRVSKFLPSIGKFKPIKREFSAKKRLLSGEWEGSIIVNGQKPGLCPAGSVTEKSGMRQHDHQPWPVFWTLSSDARLVGHLWDWRDGQDFSCYESSYGRIGKVRINLDLIKTRCFPGKPTQLPGAWMSITSSWADGRNYYHWITDALPRLMIREKLPETTRILLPPNSLPFVEETIRLLGLKDHAECPDYFCVAPEHYYFCSPVVITGAWNPLGFDWLRQSFSKYFQAPKAGKPIFLTRRAKRRNPGNIEEIENLFRGIGFEIVDAGKISVQEQIHLSSGATAIAGIHGAAMTNVLWARPGTKVLEIFEESYLNACYEQIAISGGLKYSFTIIDKSDSMRKIKSILNEMFIKKNG